MAWGDSFPPPVDPQNPPKKLLPRRDIESIDYPDPGLLAYIADKIIAKIGIAKPSNGFNGTGITKLEWQDIKAWCDLTKTDLTSFEVEMVKFLSSRYVDKFNESNQKDILPPYNADAYQAKIEAANALLTESFFEGLVKKDV